MKRLLILAASVACVMSASVVSAEDTLTANALYYPEENRILVFGTNELESVEPIDLILMKGSNKLEDISDTVAPADFRTIYTEENGSYSADINLLDNIPSGYYTLVVSSPAEKLEKPVVIINETESAVALKRINDSSGGAALASVISEAYAELGFSEYDATRCAALAAQFVSHRKPYAGYSTAGEVYEIIDEALVVTDIIAAENSSALEDILSVKATRLCIDESKFSGLENSARTKAFELLKAADYNGEAFSTVYEQTLSLASVQGASTWAKLKEAVLGNAGKFGINIGSGSDYAKVNNKDKVFQTMFKKSLTSESVIKDSFEKSVSEVLSEQSKPAKGGGGGGGNGGGSADTLVTIDNNLAAQLSEPSVKSLSDIQGHWAENEIKQLYNEGVVSGFEDGRFLPDKAVSRAEFAKLISVAFDLDLQAKYEYNDISGSEWYAPYVKAVSAAGIAKGYDGSFNPSDNATRQDMALMFYNLLTARGIEVSGSAAFSDEEEIAPYAKKAVLSLAACKIISGTGDGFAPKNNTTRAEVVKLIVNVKSYIERGEG